MRAWNIALENRVKNANNSFAAFGDWHGDISYALTALERVYEKYPQTEILYHVGDFGLWPGAEAYVDAVSQSIEAAGKVMLVTGGNHENWDRWDYFTRYDTVTYNYRGTGLVFLPKVFSWEQGGKKFVSVGGASSIDRGYRQEGISWWRQEEISPYVLDTMKEKSIQDTDFLITHEASDTPVDLIQQRLDDPIVQNQWDHHARKVSERQRELVGDVVRYLEPEIHMHGHWHLPTTRKEEHLLTVSLGANFSGFQQNCFHHVW